MFVILFFCFFYFRAANSLIAYVAFMLLATKVHLYFASVG